jgi:hypothetical protein
MAKKQKRFEFSTPFNKVEANHKVEYLGELFIRGVAYCHSEDTNEIGYTYDIDGLRFGHKDHIGTTDVLDFYNAINKYSFDGEAELLDDVIMEATMAHIIELFTAETPTT